jgi:outer membrane protein insertion porin family
VEKVCLVGASEDSYLRLHELVAPREGVPLDADAVRGDIEALFEQGLVRDVVVVAQPLPSKAVVLSYFVTEYEWLSKVNFSGAKAVKPDELAQVAHAGLRASPFVLKMLSGQVKALYAGLGYPQATAVAALKSVGGGNAELTLQIDEGTRVTVGAITFVGAQHVGEAELRKALKCELGAPWLDDLVERDAFALTAVYYDHGHVNVRVVPSSHPLPAPGGAVELVFTVTEGDIFHLGKLALTGFSLGAEKDVLKLMESKPKSVFSRTVLQRDIERLRDRAKVQGFVVEVTPLTAVDSEKKIIDVTFELEKKPGGRVQF